MLHGKMIGKVYVSLTITESYQDDIPYLNMSMETILQSLQLAKRRAISFFGQMNV